MQVWKIIQLDIYEKYLLIIREFLKYLGSLNEDEAVLCMGKVWSKQEYVPEVNIWWKNTLDTNNYTIWLIGGKEDI